MMQSRFQDFHFFFLPLQSEEQGARADRPAGFNQREGGAWATRGRTCERAPTHRLIMFPARLLLLSFHFFFFFSVVVVFSQSALRVRTSSAVWLQAESHVIVHYTYTERVYTARQTQSVHYSCGFIMRYKRTNGHYGFFYAPTHIFYLCFAAADVFIRYVHVQHGARAQAQASGQVFVVLPAAESHDCLCASAAAQPLISLSGFFFYVIPAHKHTHRYLHKQIQCMHTHTHTAFYSTETKPCMHTHTETHKTSDLCRRSVRIPLTAATVSFSLLV